MGDIVAKNVTDQLMLIRNCVQGFFFFSVFKKNQSPGKSIQKLNPVSTLYMLHRQRFSPRL